MPADPRGLRPGERARIWQLHSEGCTGAEISRQTGRHHSLITRVLASPKPDGLPEPQPQQPTEETYKRTEKGDECLISYVSGERIKTLDQALEHADVDLTKWYVDRWEVSVHEVPMRVRRGQDAEGRWKPDSPIQTDCWRVKLYLKRLLPKPLQEATDALLARMERYSPKYPKFAAVRRPSRPRLLVVDLFDVHLGKMAWMPETGNNADLRSGEAVFRNAVEDLIAEVGSQNIEKILFPIGQDFFHIDSPKNQTFAGTQMDVDGRFAKITEVGCMSIVWAVEYCLPIAPIELILIPGNHDPTASFHLAMFLSAWFRNCSRVEVDRGPRTRKYRQYGKTLLGFTHGDEVKPEKLPGIMATEVPREWGETRFREVHCGHRHRARQTQHVPVNTHDGTIVRELRALSATDKWHYDHGFVGAQRAADAFVYSPDSGFVGNWCANARE
jgi:hypothetical protein